jgi:hypothetical protein
MNWRISPHLATTASPNYNKGDYDRAIGDFDRAPAIDPNHQLAPKNKRIAEEKRAGQNKK